MVKIKVSEATNTQLDWLVAKREGKKITLMRNDDRTLFPMPVWADGLWQQNYSTSWYKMGPIIEREGLSLGINTCSAGNSTKWVGAKWCEQEKDYIVWSQYGPTPLIAAARCYVASKLGEQVEIPEELYG